MVDTVIVMGVSGAGKTTVAQDLARVMGWPMAEGDDFHPPANVAKMHEGHPLDDEDRWPWLRSIAAWIGEREAEGQNSVVTCSALKRSYRDVLRDGHPSVRFCHLITEVDLIRGRMEHRAGHFMPPTLLASQVATLEPLEPDENGVVVDVSGTEEEVLQAVLKALGLTPVDA
ncbi:MAG TPA: gluconokinase [Actinomycetales bacterium]|nr:gluconokinase [Actinomycetales bacterium]